MTKGGAWATINSVAELRRDPIYGNWVVSGYKSVQSNPLGDCPFCPGNEALTPKLIREVKDEDGSWLLRVVPASNPIFVIEEGENKRAEGLYDKMGNVGAHEIVVDHRSHTATMSSFSDKELYLLLRTYSERVQDLKRDRRFRHVQVFKNHGELAGSYIFHPHSHVLATPVIPQSTERQVENAKRHFLQKERCLFCDIVKQEIRQGKRIINISTNFVAFCPFAPKFPFESWIMPRFHSPSFEEVDAEPLLYELAGVMLDLIRRIEKVTNAYTLLFHASPNVEKAGAVEKDVPLSDYYHWHIEILPRDFRSSKYKREDQFYVVSITPEEAASALKAQKV